MFCTNCGARINDNMRFCTTCGAEVKAEATPQRDGDAGQEDAAATAPAKTARQRTPQKSRGGTRTATRRPNAKKAKRQRRGRAPIVAAVIVVAIVAIGVAAFLTKGFGLLGVMPKASVNDYSWSELSRISREIAECSDNESALKVAKGYNLTDSDGKLDGSQSKAFELTDGTPMEAVIVGFRHDNKTEGGVAGITFIFKDCVSLHAMNSSASSTGGWEQSEMREYLQDDLLIRLPEELRDNIVAVDKMSNNIGKTDSAKSVTKTSDKLWLPSNTELIGEMDKEDYAESDQFVVNIYNAEGTQYQLFTDNGVSKSDGHEFLKKAYADGSNEPVAQTWWIRSSFAVSGGFMGIGSEGEPLSGGSAEKVLGVAPGFCI